MFNVCIDMCVATGTAIKICYYARISSSWRRLSVRQGRRLTLFSEPGHRGLEGSEMLSSMVCHRWQNYYSFPGWQTTATPACVNFRATSGITSGIRGRADLIGSSEVPAQVAAAFTRMRSPPGHAQEAITMHEPKALSVTGS